MSHIVQIIIIGVMLGIIFCIQYLPNQKQAKKEMLIPKIPLNAAKSNPMLQNPGFQYPPKPDETIKAPDPQPIDPRTERAMLQREEANLLVFYEGRDRIYCKRSLNSQDEQYFTEANFKETLSSLRNPKKFIVVTFEKPVMVGATKANMDPLMDKLEKWIQVAGYKKVVFHAAHSSSIPILRERSFD